MVSLKHLEQAVAAVEDISRHTLEFEVENTRFVLRTIRPSEDLEVDALLKEDLEGIIVQRDWLAAKQYRHHQRLGILSFAIIRMGDLDLSGEYLETEETTETGTPIQVPKAQALREHMGLRWSAALLEAVFAKYCELVAQQNAKITLKVDYEKIDEHLLRLQEQVLTLQRLRVPDPTQQDVIQSVRAQQEERRAQKDAVMPETSIPSVPEAPPKEVPTSPEPIPAPAPTQAAQAAQAPEPPRSPREPTYPKEVLFDPRNPDHRGRLSNIPDPHGGDSFMDSSDPEQAIAAENARQHMYMMRQQAAQAQAAQRAAKTRPTPRMANQTPAAETRPTFRMPPEDLGGDVDAAPMVMDGAPRTGNPRFMPRR